MPKLQMLKPRLAMAPSQVQMLKARPGTVERKRGSAGVKDRNRIRKRDCGLCQMCEAAGRVSLGTEVDHKVALADGGSDTDDNKWLLCTPCHGEKTTREAAERATGGSCYG